LGEPYPQPLDPVFVPGQEEAGDFPCEGWGGPQPVRPLGAGMLLARTGCNGRFLFRRPPPPGARLPCGCFFFYFCRMGSVWAGAQPPPATGRGDLARGDCPGLTGRHFLREGWVNCPVRETLIGGAGMDAGPRGVGARPRHGCRGRPIRTGLGPPTSGDKTLVELRLEHRPPTSACHADVGQSRNAPACAFGAQTVARKSAGPARSDCRR